MTELLSKSPRKCQSNSTIMKMVKWTSRLKDSNSRCLTSISTTNLLLLITLLLTICSIMFGQEVPTGSPFHKNGTCSRISSMDYPERREPILKQKRNRSRATIHLQSPFSSRRKKSSKLCSYRAIKLHAERRSCSILH